ncbi:DUF2569 domain-containing protein [Xenorhabdus taiwanensis]|uniref:DUF2569 domain-containing protein n=1 Tax=Xenorhabdus taiwanensis TaxID=3085177 RepID=A0ABM8JW71_9GAMM|nr:hypothetical protein TCT1_18810 [Xenorhabdus sp. TCT-1]
MDKWTCTQCGEKEISQDAKVCTACGEKSFKKIGGWLYLPAISLIFMLISSIYEIVTGIQLTYTTYVDLAEGWRPLYTFVFIIAIILDISLFILIIFTTTFFLKKSKKAPRFYISVLIFNIVIQGATILYSIGLHVKPDMEDIAYLVRAIFYSAIWIPYFLVSVRVKRTFVN